MASLIQLSFTPLPRHRTELGRPSQRSNNWFYQPIHWPRFELGLQMAKEGCCGVSKSKKTFISSCIQQEERLLKGSHWKIEHKNKWNRYRMFRQGWSICDLLSGTIMSTPGIRNVIEIPFLPMWNQYLLSRIGHSLLLASSLILLQSASLDLIGAPAWADDVARLNLSLDYSKIKVSETQPDVSTQDRSDISLTLRTMGFDKHNFTADSSTSASKFKISNSTSSIPTVISPISANEDMCREAYGIFPCSNSLMGNLFLILVYGYLLLMAAKLISEGSELLLEVMNPGVIGGLLLPILGALPDAALVFASGTGSTIQEAQQEVYVGVGVLAGSTTLIVSVAWAGSLIAGRCDLSGPDGTAKDLTLTRGYNLFETGVTTDEQTRWGALIMILSSVPYICAQLPLLDGNLVEGPESALAGCILAFSGLFVYSIYQIASPWLQKKRIEEARLQLLRSSALQGIVSFQSSPLMSSAAFQDDVMGPSQGLLKEIFGYFDKNGDGKIEEDELRGLILGLNVEQGYFPDKKQEDTWLMELDTDTDGKLTENEFFLGIKKWANQVAKKKEILKFQQIKDSLAGGDVNFWGAQFEEARKTLNLLESELEDGADEVSKGAVIDSSKIYPKASIFLLSGAVLAATFSDPLIDSIEGFSTASRIPPFFVAFVVIPFASNASELLSSILFATRKRKRNISLTYSQIYGSITMNNTLCLGIFLGLVYARGLTWDFSSEVTVVLFNIICVGLIGVSRTTFPLWYAIPVLSLYFVSLGGVALLDNLLGWH